MAHHLPLTYDNNVSAPLSLTEGQRGALLCLSGRKLKELVDTDSGNNLLVFPQDFGQYGNNIEDDCLFEIRSNNLYTGNLMGFVGCNGYMLKIGSRFDKRGKDNFMHYMLERVLSINLFDLNHDTEPEDIFDFLPFLFPYYLKNALSQGLFKEYKVYEMNDSHMSGMLDVNRHIKLNYPATGNIAYRTREHTHDNNTTQLIRHTIEHIRTKDFGDGILGCDEDTKTYVAQIIEATSSFDRNRRNKVINDNLRAKIHPYYSEYEPLRVLCLQILRNEEVKYGADDDAVNGIIFDGAWLWEEYLNTIIAQCGIKHPKNKTKEGAIHLFVGHKGKRFPDFIGEGIVLDAKYKGYGNRIIQEVDRDDLHQVITYMYITQSHTGAFLFPQSESNIIVDSNTLNGYGGTMHLIGLPISSKLDYLDFKLDMAKNEDDYRKAIKALMTEQSIL